MYFNIQGLVNLSFYLYACSVANKWESANTLFVFMVAYCVLLDNSKRRNFDTGFLAALLVSFYRIFFQCLEFSALFI